MTLIANHTAFHSTEKTPLSSNEISGNIFDIPELVGMIWQYLPFQNKRNLAQAKKTLQIIAVSEEKRQEACDLERFVSSILIYLQKKRVCEKEGGDLKIALNHCIAKINSFSNRESFFSFKQQIIKEHITLSPFIQKIMYKVGVNFFYNPIFANEYLYPLSSHPSVWMANTSTCPRPYQQGLWNFVAGSIDINTPQNSDSIASVVKHIVNIAKGGWKQHAHFLLKELEFRLQNKANLVPIRPHYSTEEVYYDTGNTLPNEKEETLEHVQLEFYLAAVNSCLNDHLFALAEEYSIKIYERTGKKRYWDWAILLKNECQGRPTEEIDIANYLKSWKQEQKDKFLITDKIFFNSLEGFFYSLLNHRIKSKFFAEAINLANFINGEENLDNNNSRLYSKSLSNKMLEKIVIAMCNETDFDLAVETIKKYELTPYNIKSLVWHLSDEFFSFLSWKKWGYDENCHLDKKLLNEVFAHSLILKHIQEEKIHSAKRLFLKHFKPPNNEELCTITQYVLSKLTVALLKINHCEEATHLADLYCLNQKNSFLKEKGMFYLRVKDHEKAADTFATMEIKDSIPDRFESYSETWLSETLSFIKDASY